MLYAVAIMGVEMRRRTEAIVESVNLEMVGQVGAIVGGVGALVPRKWGL